MEIYQDWPWDPLWQWRVKVGLIPKAQAAAFCCSACLQYPNKTEICSLGLNSEGGEGISLPWGGGFSGKTVLRPWALVWPISPNGIIVIGASDFVGHISVNLMEITDPHPISPVGIVT